MYANRQINLVCMPEGRFLITGLLAAWFNICKQL